MGYHHLNIDVREVILKMRAQQVCLEEIGRQLNRPKPKRPIYDMPWAILRVVQFAEPLQYHQSDARDL